jgi:hypothetical protein
MERSKKRKAVYTKIGVWREPDGPIHMTIKGVKNGHVAVNADPAKRNGHPTLFARLDQLLKDAPQLPDAIKIVFVSPDGTRSDGPTFKIDPLN